MGVKPQLTLETFLEMGNNVPATPWVLQEVLPEQSVVMVSGLGHTSKTFLALDACLSVAYGIPWLGHFPTTQGVALYVGEDSPRHDVLKQMRKLLVGRKLTGQEVPDDLLFCVTQGASLSTEEEANRIAQAIFRVRPKLVVLDSLRYLSIGADENDSTAMSKVIDHVKALRNLGPAVMLIHHNSLGSRPRGSTTIYDGVDGAINVKYDKRKDLVSAVIEKRRCITAENFCYHHLWDQQSAILEYVALKDAGASEDKLLLALLTERGTISTAQAVSCITANTKNSDQLTVAVLANRTNRALQRLKVAGLAGKNGRGEWSLVSGSEVVKAA